MQVHEVLSLKHRLHDTHAHEWMNERPERKNSAQRRRICGYRLPVEMQKRALIDSGVPLPRSKYLMQIFRQPHRCQTFFCAPLVYIWTAMPVDEKTK